MTFALLIGAAMCGLWCAAAENSDNKAWLLLPLLAVIALVVVRVWAA